MRIELYGTAQDFAQVDNSFRRLVNELVHITKLLGSPRPSATRPPVKRIWGLCRLVSLDPQTYDETEDKFANKSLLDLHFFWIRREHCEIFDTGQKIKRSKPLLLKH